MIRALVSLAIAALVAATASTQAQQRVPANEELVAKPETAIAIAVAVFKPIYGSDTVAKSEPYVAEPKGDVWHVHGTLPRGWRGGTPEAEISRKDGRVIR